MPDKPSFKISEIYLLESHFKREAIVNFDHPDFDNSVSIEADHVLNNDTLFITLLLNFSAGVGKKKDITSKIKMVGVFVCGGNELSVEQFAKANGPAIMFPFLREHLASTSLKAGISPILLPAINFIKLSEENKIKKIVKKSKSVKTA